tara:strand:+ start:3128 stop:4441 length:1314 start_codon:yes stop_codon:yes gene_type:complete
MASILTPSAFQIKIKEEHVVKGIKTTNETFFTLGNITNVDRRIVTIPAQTPIDLFNVNGVRPSAGTFPSSSMKYARITNLDTTSSLAVSFTSSKSPDGIGVIGTDLTSSYTSGGSGGVIGLYPSVPTTSSISGSGMTLDVVVSSSLIMSQSLSINSAPTDCATGTYNVNLSGGSGTGATAQAVVTGADPSQPTLTTVMVLDPGRGYVVDDSLTITGGDLGTGQLVTGQAFVNNGLTPNVTNNITREIAVYTTTGQGGTVNVVSIGGVVSTVTPVNIGTGYLQGQVITISKDQLTNVGFGNVSSDYTCTLVSNDVENSGLAALAILTSSNITTDIFQAKIAAGGSGYEAGETVTVNGAEIGNSTDAIFTLTLNDFTENGARSYWTMDVLPTSSLMFSSPQVTGSTFNGFFEQDIEFVSVYAETERMDVEYVVVNSDNA